MFLGLKNFFLGLWNSFLMLIFNQKCILCSCAKTQNLLCKTCAKDVQFLSTFPHKIYNNIPIYSATIYDGNIKKLIHKLKFKHKKIAGIALAQILYDYFKKFESSSNKDLIIVYPSSYIYKSFYRGFEHMFIICKEFQKLSGLELRKNLIKKTKYTKPQYSVKNKFKNIKNSFKINIKNPEDLVFLRQKTFLLIDDITTSGATIQEIIDEFQKVEINNIFVLTISKTKI